MQELEADSLFQVLIKLFYAVFGIEDASQIKTELKEILAESVRIDAIVTFPDDFDFTKLIKRIFPWLGKHSVFEYKGKSDWLKVGQYFQYSFVELGLIFTFFLNVSFDQTFLFKRKVWLLDVLAKSGGIDGDESG
jgi:hypothetical protein